jgi:hypothetical protein
MSKSFTIKIPKESTLRHPLGTFQERKQIMKDRRTKRAKDAKNGWQKEWQ